MRRRDTYSFTPRQDTACVDSVKLQLATVALLLCNNGERARDVIEKYDPPFESKEKFLAFLDSMCDSVERIIYNENGTATVRIDK